jgi:hypothetical protein
MIRNNLRGINYPSTMATVDEKPILKISRG